MAVMRSAYVTRKVYNKAAAGFYICFHISGIKTFCGRFYLKIRGLLKFGFYILIFSFSLAQDGKIKNILREKLLVSYPVFNILRNNLKWPLLC